MKLHEVVRKAIHGDPLGEKAARSSWTDGSVIEISINSNSIEDIGCGKWVPCIDDILADDWVCLGSSYNGDQV